jgi:flavodoxin
MSKLLIAYYSRTGSNYVNGSISNLTIGNTAVIAEKIQKLTGGTLFEIRTIKEYPLDYIETTKVSKDELRNNARPELSTHLTDLEHYDIIYLGYPNWWGTMPMAVFTFLESYNFQGKTIVPFCTHEGSGKGKSENDIRRLCPKSIVLPGIAVYGSSVTKADKEISEWLRKQNLILENI